ncbi:MAG: A24 family peptidase [Gammaproteobacteria bacterium]
MTPELIVPVALVFGLIVGSFLNVVIHRLPIMMHRDWRAQCAEELGVEVKDPEAPEGRFNLVVPRSRCPACGHQISASENIPVLSWLLLKGKCSACSAKISARYPAIEILTGVLFAITALVALAFIDIDEQLLPDSLTLPLLWAGLLYNLFAGEAAFATLEDAVIGAAAGYLSLGLVYQGFRLATGKEGMGFGDFKLLAALGAWLGWQMLPLVILLSAVVGALIGIAMIVALGRDRQIPIPFGPYLAAAGWIALVWGDALTAAWLNYAGL